jgi:hypothetical protein
LIPGSSAAAACWSSFSRQLSDRSTEPHRWIVDEVLSIVNSLN